MGTEHANNPHERKLQNVLAEELTTRVHSAGEYQAAVEASNILFGNSTSAQLMSISEDTLLAIFEGVPQVEVPKALIEAGIRVTELLAGKTGFLSSNGEARRALKENSISVNKEKVNEEHSVGTKDLVNGRYILLQRGKKNYFLVKAV